MAKRSLLVPLAVLAAACGGDSLGEGRGDGGLNEPCTPGQVAACRCPSGATSQTICTSQKAYGACICTGAGDGAAAGAPGTGGLPGATAGSSGGTTGGDAGVPPEGPRDAADAAVPDARVDTSLPSTACMAAGKLSGGTQHLLGLFVVDGGFLIARPDGIDLVLHDRSIKKTWTAPRPLTSVSFDGVRVAAADAARVNVLDAALTFQGDITLTEACASSVIVDNGVFVCGPSNDWDRVFYTFDLKSRTALKASAKYTYNGIPMRRVPGANSFVTVTDTSSPSDFHLYSVDPATGATVYVNESPYHGDFPVTTVYGFNATPATHVVNVDGRLLKVSGDGCVPGSSFTSGCFVKDGTLGTLRQGERFSMLTNVADGRLFALTSQASSFIFDPPCMNGCWLQELDVAQRKIVSERKQTAPLGRITTMVVDPACGVALVGYDLTSNSSIDFKGHQVDVLEL